MQDALLSQSEPARSKLQRPCSIRRCEQRPGPHPLIAHLVKWTSCFLQRYNKKPLASPLLSLDDRKVAIIRVREDRREDAHFEKYIKVVKRGTSVLISGRLLSLFSLRFLFYEPHLVRAHIQYASFLILTANIRAKAIYQRAVHRFNVALL